MSEPALHADNPISSAIIIDNLPMTYSLQIFCGREALCSVTTFSEASFEAAGSVGAAIVANRSHVGAAGEAR